ncbi:MAG: sulfurtransferase TusA family protein [Gammaproteobacteria bacterium]|jgi:tRNA 2-thiouridine synthesizing protein A|nr:sulfurtransferase TusA family protein [Gammaproteobacteria bacterium]MBT4493446.1 sulfurtransferase TusA family protein [Gammaproteobacteria bacterium]MBT7372322.1 sulfurtransferase TusA family protein [Gammaproteobacteria bacterium]
MSEIELDARHLLCPLPVIRTQDKIASLESGDTIIVTCTDPGTLNDIPAWCRIHGHEMLEHRTEGRELSFRILVHK